MMTNEDIRIQYLGNIQPSTLSIFYLTLISASLNALLYKLIPSSVTPLIKSYMISTIHALISVLGVSYFYFKHNVDFKQMNRIIGGGVNGTGDEIMIYSLCYSSGYLIYDLTLMLIHKSVQTMSALTHHTVILTTFLTGLFYRIGRPCHFYLLLEELSTIPLNLKTIYHKRSRFHKLFSLIFVICFFTVRLIYGSIVCYYALVAAPKFFQMTWNSNDMKSFVFGIIQLSLCIMTRVLNFYWAILIFEKTFKFKIFRRKNKIS